MSHNQTTDLQLISSLVTPDISSDWSSFVTLYQPLLQSWFKRKGLNDADSQDCAQRVLLRLLRSISTYQVTDEKGSFRKWLYRVAIHEAISFVRSEAKHRTTLHDSLLISTLSTESDASLSQELSSDLQRHLFLVAANRVEQQVSSKHWQAFWRTYVQNESAVAVANELGMKVGAIYVAKGRILKLLQREIQDLRGEVE